VTTGTYTLTVTRQAFSGGGGGGGAGDSEFPVVVATRQVNSSGATFGVNVGNAVIQVQVPAGAFSSTEEITLTTTNLQTLPAIIVNLPFGEIPAAALGVSYSGPASTKPVTVTIADTSFPGNASVYNLVGDLLIPVNAAVTPGRVVLSFTSDPDFVVLVPKLQWGTTQLPAWTEGQSVQQKVTVTGGPSPYTWSVEAGALPAGMTLNSATGVLQGNPTSHGQGQVTIQVKDAAGDTATEVLSWDVLMPYERRVLLNGESMNVPGLVRNDGGTLTTYMPIWYVMQMLKPLGITSTWTGKDWFLTQAGQPNLANPSVGSGSINIYLNGTMVQKVNTVAAPDPSTNRPTTYMPIWYVMQLLNRLGLHSGWNGTTWTITK